MLKANELRIGNYLTDELGAKLDYDGLGIVSKIYDNTFDIQDVSYKGGKINAINVMSPIPLTEEWLLKFGIMEWWQKELGNKGAIHYNEGHFYIYSGMGDCDSYGFKIKIDYVHQLQNWWYANTNEELQLS